MIRKTRHNDETHLCQPTLSKSLLDSANPPMNDFFFFFLLFTILIFFLLLLSHFIQIIGEKKIKKK